MYLRELDSDQHCWRRLFSAHSPRTQNSSVSRFDNNTTRVGGPVGASPEAFSSVSM